MSYVCTIIMAGNFKKLQVLGAGTFGKAWLVMCTNNKKKAVLKSIKLDTLSDKEINQAIMEVKILAKCRHVNIVSYICTFVESGCLQIVMEYADAGDLQKRITDQRGIHFDVKLITDWFIQICFALKYLHSQSILHRDLKPQNLFLTSDDIVKVGDFGISRFLQDTGDHALTAIGTPYYLSPEICQHKPYNFKSDMWAVGCILYEMCSHFVPFQAPNLPLLMANILQGAYPPVPSCCGPLLQDLVTVLLKLDPFDRPSAAQVLSIPVLQGPVRVAYNKCVRHRRRQDNDHHYTGHHNTNECNTYSVKSPVLRRFSMLTPRLKASKKRFKSVQSAASTSLSTRIPQVSDWTMCDLHNVTSHQQMSIDRLHDHCAMDDHDDICFTSDNEAAQISFHDSVFDDEELVTCVLNEPNSGGPGDCNKSKVCFCCNADLIDASPSDEKSGVCEQCQNCSLTNGNSCSVYSKNVFQEASDRNGTSKHELSVYSRTYTLLSGVGEPGYIAQCCIECKNSGLTQRCLNSTLYSVIAFSQHDKQAAQRCLAHFLISHLDTHDSFYLCGVISSALQAGDSYDSLQGQLHQKFWPYLPVAFQLLNDTWDRCIEL